MPLPAAEHARVLRETKEERNARAWVRRRGGTVEAFRTPGGPLYWVKIPGFHPRCFMRLEWAVDDLKAAVAAWPGEKGPTGARLRGPVERQ